MKHILLPTDFSDNAWNAIIYALKLYADEYCTFYFLHTTYNSEAKSRTLITKHFLEQLKEETLLELNDLKEQAEITNANSNHDYEILLRENELQSAVAEVVKQYDIDMVVMGTKGATNAMEYLLGSNTVNVLKKDNCPVLMVPDMHDFVPISQIAFPTDYNRFYSKNELTPLLKMADMCNAVIRVVHINVEKELSDLQLYNVDMLEDLLQDGEYSLHWLPDYTKKAEAITTFIQDLNIDMLVIVKYKHNLFEALFKEPIIKNLALHPKVPILVMHELKI